MSDSTSRRLIWRMYNKGLGKRSEKGEKQVGKADNRLL